jgi:large subunit ribosomal protein L25
MEVIAISGTARPATGKRAAKDLRNSGSIPCIMYGGKEPVSFSIDPNAARHLIYTPDFKQAELSVDGVVSRCIVKDIQFHPVSEKVLHIDFLELVAGQKVRYEVPVRFLGVGPGVRAGGKLLTKIRRVKVLSLPEAMINEVSVDTSTMDLAQSIRVKDIPVTAGVEILNAPTIPIATIDVPRSLRNAAAADAKAATKGAKKKK